MRKIREILRLKWESQCGYHVIARVVGASSSTVSECVRRATVASLSWPLPVELDDAQLEALLYPPVCRERPEEAKAIDWVAVDKELKRKHVTLMLVWQEYQAQHPQGLRYSRFCALYREWKGTLDVWMRQTHKAGEKCFVDYAGMTVRVLLNSGTGEMQTAQIFVATLGASNFTFCEATWSQQLPDWIGSHVRAFEFFGGVPEIVVPDNLKGGVEKSHRYEPDINPTYQDMATHYGVAVLAARVYTPKDKAKVENAVGQVERRILAPLRNRTFLSLAELNQAIRPLLNTLNESPFQKYPGSRLSHFNEIDKPALKPLPATPYAYAQWKKVRAGVDYHVELEKHYYSVPYTYKKKELDLRYTLLTLEIFYKSKRIASHIRSTKRFAHTTQTVHMPKKHQAYAQWTPERIRAWAQKTGTATAALTERVIQSRAHPQQGFRACLGILRFEKSYGATRLEAACQRALDIGAHSYKSVESILRNNLDQKPLIKTEPTTTRPSAHENVRGQDYFK
jgi:transposase